VGVKYELNKKTQKAQGQAGVDGQELEFTIPEELFVDLVTSWQDPTKALVEKRRGAIVTGDGLIIEFDTFKEPWVLGDASFLVEVEYDPEYHNPEQIEALVSKAFSGVENVSGNPKYKNENIARRIAEARSQGGAAKLA
jgi:hypothetical protein